MSDFLTGNVDVVNPNPVPISGTVTANLGTIDGAATAANQTTEIANQTNGTQVTQVNNFPAVQVVSILGASGTEVNVYGDVLAAFNVETTIVSYTVPAGKTFRLTTIEMWGDYFAEYFVRVDGVQKSGTNVSAAARSKTLEFEVGSILANDGQVVTTSVQHQAMGTVKFHANISGILP